MLKVVFRTFTTGPGKGEVIALFPTLAGDGNPGTCLSYMQTCQHGTASADLTDRTRMADPEEYISLLQELQAIGYNDLVVYRRMTYADYTSRVADIKRIRHESGGE